MLRTGGGDCGITGDGGGGISLLAVKLDDLNFSCDVGGGAISIISTSEPSTVSVLFNDDDGGLI